MRLQLQHFKLLAVICLNHVRFVYQCFQTPPKFIQKQLPLYDDEHDDVNNEILYNDVPSSMSDNTKTAFETTEQNSNTNLTMKTNISSTATSTADQKRVTTDASNPRCECYVKLCLSVVTLIFQLLRQWLLHKREHCK